MSHDTADRGDRSRRAGRVIVLPDHPRAPRRSPGRTLVVPLRTTAGKPPAAQPPAADAPEEGKSAGKSRAVPAPAVEGLTAWTGPVTTSGTACVLVDVDENVVAMSPRAREVLHYDAEVPVPLSGIQGLGPLVAGQPVGAPAQQPVSMALGSGTFVRQLMRFTGEGATVTLDAVCVPLVAAGAVAGVLLWFAVV